MRTVKMALYPLTGPKTPATVEDTDTEPEASEWESDEDETVDEVVEEEDVEEAVDEIEQWTEEERL